MQQHGCTDKFCSLTGDDENDSDLQQGVLMLVVAVLLPVLVGPPFEELEQVSQRSCPSFARLAASGAELPLQPAVAVAAAAA